MSERAVLIITQELDPHADVLVMHLEKRGLRPIRFHPRNLGTGAGLSCRIDGEGYGWELETESRRFGKADIASVWYRRPMFAADPSLEPEEQEFARQEIQAALMGILRLTDALWVNHPDAIRIAETKLVQLRLARRLGFAIPPTLITNRPDEVLEFHRNHGGDVVCKVMTQGLLGQTEAKGVYTNRINEGHLSHVGAVRAAPVMLQGRIEKLFDVRVTVIGRKLFATAIDSQVQAESRTDWRRGKVETIKHRPLRLPSEVAARCRKLVRELGLVYGAIDLIATPDGGWTFLEINPSGQFAWIESMTGQPLMAALVDVLLDKRPRR